MLDAGAFSFESTDYSQFGMSANAKQGQTLEEARDLLLAELAKVRNGQFDDWLIEAVVNDKRQQQTRFWNENNSMRASALTNAFILRKDWADVVGYLDRMGKIAQEQVMAFAKERFGDNYVCVFKRTGEDKNTFKVTKPAITAIPINRDAQSDWFKEWEAAGMKDIEPAFVDYDKSIQRGTLKSGVPVASIPNTSNDLFTLVMVQDLGEHHDPKLKLAVEYLPYLGTEKYSASQLQQEFFKLGLEFSVQSGTDRNTIAPHRTGEEHGAGPGLAGALARQRTTEQGSVGRTGEGHRQTTREQQEEQGHHHEQRHAELCALRGTLALPQHPLTSRIGRS